MFRLERVSTVLCILLSVRVVVGQFGQFTIHPSSQSVVLGENATFHTSFSNPGLPLHWIVALAHGGPLDTLREDEQQELRGLGIIADGNYLTIPANVQTNGSSVLCRVVGTLSEEAFLTVLGPPSPPEPVMTPVNSTMLRVSWFHPFTWPEHPITNYTIAVTNTTDGEVTKWHSNETSFPIVGEGGCDVLVVNVTASSNIGEGDVGQVSGGLPISPESVQFIDCDVCQVSFLQDGTPMYAIQFKLPEICSYQNGTYHVGLYGLTDPNHQSNIAQGSYSPTDVTTPRTFSIESGLRLNHSYTIVITVSNVAGSITNNITFSTDYRFPVIASTVMMNEQQTTITGISHTPILVGGIIVGLIIITLVILVTLLILRIYKRRYRTGVAQISLAKMFMEHTDSSQPFRTGGPYTQTETRIYETIDGYQGEMQLAKIDTTSPTCPPRPFPSLPPPREDHHYYPERLQIPQIVLEGERDNNVNNPYLQLVSDKDKNRMDPEVHSIGSGDYTTMKSVSLKKEEFENISAVNKLAVQTGQGFNEDNYMVFLENQRDQ